MIDLLFIHWNVDPEAFTIPGIDWPIRWYGILFVIGLILSQQIMLRVFRVEGKPEKLIDDLTLYIVLGTVVGARLGHILFYDIGYYLSNPLEILIIWHGGLASHGGAIGILVALWLFCKKHKIGYLWMLDRLVIVVILTGGFIRLGNLMNSEILGVTTDVPWAFVFERIDAQPRHPAQLYESIFCFILLPVLYFMWSKRRHVLNTGVIFGVFMIALWTFRFLIEFLKVDQESFNNPLALNVGQLLSIPFALTGIIIIYLVNRKGKKPTTE